MIVYTGDKEGCTSTDVYGYVYQYFSDHDILYGNYEDLCFEFEISMLRNTKLLDNIWRIKNHLTSLGKR